MPPDSVNFLANISSEDKPRLIAMAFEQLMVLYNLVGYRDNISIAEGTEEPISFNLHMQSIEDAENLIKELNFTEYSFCGQMFRSILSRNGDIVTVIIFSI